jgi:hypothetical protein
MVATEPSGLGDTDGWAYIAANARNVLFANNRIVTAGTYDGAIELPTHSWARAAVAESDPDALPTLP